MSANQSAKGTRTSGPVVLWVPLKIESLNKSRGHWSKHHRARRIAGKAWAVAVADPAQSFGLHSLRMAIASWTATMPKAVSNR
jgi:hypothetical protein